MNQMHKLKKVSCYCAQKAHRICSSSFFKSIFLYRFILVHVPPFLYHLFYFITFSVAGFSILKMLKPRTSTRPRDIDLFFTSVSSITVSSMSTVEMEVFSNAQLVVMTFLMFVGGEVFLSMVALHLRYSHLNFFWKVGDGVDGANVISSNTFDEIELGSISSKPNSSQNILDDEAVENSEALKYSSIRYLGFVVLGYVIVVHVLGVSLVSIYIALVSSARNAIENKGLKLFTFSVFTTVSTFANCGFVPTNENMIVFSKNSGLLFILIPQILLGNTLFPLSLRFSIWVFGKMFKEKETKYLLKNTSEIGYLNLLPRLHSSLLVATVFGFIAIQWTMFCIMEWSSQGLSGLNSYEKLVASLFQSVNSRHTGETIVDISILSPSILVLYIVMMYLPPYTSFLPVKDGKENEQVWGKRRRGRKIADNIKFSQLSYLVIFVILICITERDKLKGEDPLNFNVVNIVIEVISAYGNVGFTTGYSCARRIHNTGHNCEDKWYGFAGRWSDEGKIILIIVMFFGRLKKFNMDGGKAWKLL